jgi:ABC-type Mn2+/Zn2+ transport system permease subunit
MGGVILALLLRAVPYLLRLFWPALGTGVLIAAGVDVVRDGISGAIDGQLALVFLGGIALGVAACILWGVGSIGEYRRTEPPQPHL